MTVPSTAARTRTLAAVILVATLVAGFALGWGMSRWSLERSMRGHNRRGPHFLDALNLSAAQHARIDSILVRRRAQMDAFWKGPGMQLRALVDSTRSEIRGVLTPAQQREFDAARARAHQHSSGNEPPPPPADEHP